MTESQEIIIIDLKKLIKQQITEALNKDAKEIKIIISDSELDLDIIDIEREQKRWRNSMGYYSLNPGKFNFGLRDL
ncbi:MAG: hypothetical protein ACFE85_13365 [Candidatus Hodarchaeota archaeon]